MPLVLTEDATLVCNHETGRVGIEATQGLVTISKTKGAVRRVLVERNPEGRPITGCPLAPPLKPCLTTLAVREGYSDLLRIDGKRVCIDTVTGFTDGTPPGVVKYKVRRAGQDFVSSAI